MGKRCYGCMKWKNQGPVCEHCGFDERNKNEVHQLPMGTILKDQYLVGRVLGQGGFGITYFGWDKNLDFPVAIKEYFPRGYVSRDNSQSMMVTDLSFHRDTMFQENKQRFLKEARTLASLRENPQVVQVLNFFEANNTAYIVMEYLDGRNLRQYVENRGRKLSVEETLSILRPVMAALSAIHMKKLVHRDVSPDNIMLLPSGKVKLLDFGAVRYVENADAEGVLSFSTQAIVKRGFAPFEQYFARGALGPWTDIYALCATIYFCLTGTVPPDAQELIFENKEINWTGLPGLTARQAAALRKGTAHHGKDRFQAIEELSRELFSGDQTEPVDPDWIRRVFEDREKQKPDAGTKPVPQRDGGTEPVTRTGGEDKPKTPKNKWLLGIIAVLVVAVMGLSSALAGNSREREQPVVSYQEPGSIHSGETKSEETQAEETQAPPVETTEEPTEQFAYLGGSYDGYAQDSVPHGQGRLTWEEGYYEGQFHQGFPRGEGVFHYADGTKVESDNWSYGTADHYYEGGKLSGQRAGSYSGMLAGSKFSGHGKLDIVYGGVYEGGFQDGHPYGQGTYISYSGTSIGGTWTWGNRMKDSFNRELPGGTMYYTGMLCNGSYSGFGMLEFENCGTFYGEFQGGTVSGRGGYVYQSPVPENQPIMEGNSWAVVENQYKHDHKYFGLTLNGQWQGFGLGITKQSYVYAGEIRNEFRNGHGTLYTPSGTVYQEGTYANGSLR